MLCARASTSPGGEVGPPGESEEIQGAPPAGHVMGTLEVAQHRRPKLRFGFDSIFAL